MAIQIPNLGLGDGETGDNELVIRQKYNTNFSNSSHAASRLVGTATGNVMEVGAFGLGSTGGGQAVVDASNIGTTNNSFCSVSRLLGNGLPDVGYNYSGILRRNASGGTVLTLPFPDATVINSMGYHFVTFNLAGAVLQVAKIYTDKNTTIVNGSLKPSSPVVKIHTDSLELNDDAERMGVTLNKRGVGDYLLQNTTGLRNDGGWRIELPQDVNGNPYFAVAYNELENNDIEIKTYKRIFDMNTFMFVPDLDNPVDIKEGRSIAIRFNDLPLGDTQAEV